MKRDRGDEGDVCIIVVDDHPEIRDLVRDLLEEEGYEMLAFYGRD